MSRRVHLLVEGMYLRADSIARDAHLQLGLMRNLGLEVEVFADRFDAAHYPGVRTRALAELEAAHEQAPALLVYHWVDGWREAEALLPRLPGPLVIRWHNNTPPWFFAPYSPLPTHKTVRGFTALLRTAERLPAARFWVNSQFSQEQLISLGIAPARIDVLAPASPLLESTAAPAPAPSAAPGAPIRLLFVGRIVPHKGQLHVIAAAAALQQMTGRPVWVVLPGRGDADMPGYVAELTGLARRLGVRLELPGEIAHEQLAAMYRAADVFVGLSEHEGFGLPILEAVAHDVPVVAYQSSAVTETVADHPLAVTTLDPVEVARRLLAALDPAARAELIAWQRAAILPRFSTQAVERKLYALLGAAGVDLPAPPPTVAESPAPAVPQAVAAALAHALAHPDPVGTLPRDLPRDQNPHFVTRWDLRAYSTLLRPEATGELRERAFKFRFGSHRPRLGALFGLVKMLVLRLQDGLLRTMEISHGELADQLRSIDDKLDTLAGALGDRRLPPAPRPGEAPRADETPLSEPPATR